MPALSLSGIRAPISLTGGYREVFERPLGIDVTSIVEENFFADTIDALENADSPAVMFLVDDLLFVRDFRVDWLAPLSLTSVVPSVRLDAKITYSQPHECESPPPELRAGRGPWNYFSWTESNESWAMPLALDGNVFGRREILALLKRLPFKNPNSLEAEMGQYRFWFKYRKGSCLPERCIQNFALNRVQVENETFPCGEHTVESLLAKWDDGYQIDIDEMSEIESDSTHIVCEPIFEFRPAGE